MPSSLTLQNDISSNKSYIKVNGVPVLTFTPTDVSFFNFKFTSSQDYIFPADFGFGNASQGTPHSGGFVTDPNLSLISVRQQFGTDNTGWSYRIAKNVAGNLTDLFTVRDDGNVGIGITAPPHKLSVAGNIGVNFGGGVNSLVFQDNRIENQEYDGDSSILINYAGYQGSTTRFRDLGVYDGKNNSLLYVKASSGNIGIGTTLPAYKLDVRGTMSATAGMFTTSISAPSLSGNFYGDGSNLNYLNATNISSGTINNLRLPSAVTFATSVSAPSLSGGLFYGDGTNLTGVIHTQYVPPDAATFTTSVSAPSISAAYLFGNASNLTGLPATYTPPANATFTGSVSAPSLSGIFYGDGSNLTGVSKSLSAASTTTLGLVKIDGNTLSYNVNGQLYYTGVGAGSGVSLGGASSNVSYNSPSIVLFTGNGVDSLFAIPLSAYVGNNPLDYLISINGLIQTPTVNFTINSNSLSFTSPPPKNTSIQLQSSNKGTGYVTSPDFVSLTNNGSTVFQISSSLDSLSLIKSTRYFVIVNGLVQTPGVDYYISYTDKGRFINFNSSFPVSTNIGIFTFNYGVFGIPEPTITTFVGNGSSSVFGNLSGAKTFTSLNSKDYQVLINGLLQSSVTDYSISSALSGSIVFSEPPPSNSQITVLTNFYGTYSNYVASINGKTGNVNFYASDIPEFQNPYTIATAISASSDYIGVNINNKIRYLRLYDN
jgi:hypothetical protein